MEIKKKTRSLLIRITMLTIYLTSGAAIFSAIEGDGSRSDEDVDNKVTEIKKKMTLSFNATASVVDRYVQELRKLFVETPRCGKYSHNNWSYYQSLYFVGSVTTTIGYGHLAPKTQEGRLFLIFFALFGIPLNLLTLQSIGEHINYGIHLIIKYFEKVALQRETPTNEHIKCFTINLLLITLWLPLGGVMYYYSETEWTFLDCVYYCFVALSTIGFGDLVPNEGKAPNTSYEKGMWIVRLMYLGLGLSLLSSVFTSVCSAAKQIQSLMPCKRETTYEVSRTAQRQLPTPKAILALKEISKLSKFCPCTSLVLKDSTNTQTLSGHLKLPDADSNAVSFSNSAFIPCPEELQYPQYREKDSLGEVDE